MVDSFVVSRSDQLPSMFCFAWRVVLRDVAWYVSTAQCELEFRLAPRAKSLPSQH